MTEYQQLITFVFHAEKVASRRLALKESISEEMALQKILQNVAGKNSVMQLLEARQTLAKVSADKLASRRQKKSLARAQKSTMHQMTEGAWLGWFDGSARPNPGRCGIGCVLKGPNGEYIEICREIGHGDSSDAEYGALIATLEMALQMRAMSLTIYGDSRVVIDDANLAPGTVSNLSAHRSRAQFLMRQLHAVNLRWIPRHKNLEADLLSQRASS